MSTRREPRSGPEEKTTKPRVVPGLAYNAVNPIKDAVPMPGRDFTVSYQLTF